MEFEIKDGLMAKIDKATKTASIYESPKATGDILIPSFVEKDNIKYKIISIGSYAFQKCKIGTLSFPEDSEIEIFETRCFYHSTIQKLQIPSKVNKIDECFIHIDDIKEIEISQNNQLFRLHNNQFLLGKSNQDSDKFNVLHFAMFNVEEAIIPSEVSVIKKYSFYYHKNLKSVIFDPNSELKIIENNAFTSTRITDLSFPASVEEIEDESFGITQFLKSAKFPVNSKLQRISKAFTDSKIEHISLPASVEYIDEGCFSFSPNLREIEISPENKFYKLIDGKYVARGSSGAFDTIFLVRRDIESITIPANIKMISSYAFQKCKKLKTILFEDNSSLELIKKYVFCLTSPEKIVFPSSLKEVGAHSLSGNKNTKSVEFLGNTVKINDSCFLNCDQISTVIFRNAEQVIFGEKAMKGIPNDTKILVRKSAQLSGEGLDECRSQIFFIEDLEAEAEKKKQEEAERMEREVTEAINNASTSTVNFVKEAFDKPAFNDDDIKNVPKDDVFITDEDIEDHVQVKPYEDFLPTILLQLTNSSFSKTYYEKLTELLGDDAVIVDVTCSPPAIRVALLSAFDESDVKEKLEAYIDEVKKKFVSEEYQSVVGNIKGEPEICIPKEEEIRKACCRPSFNFIDNPKNIDEKELKRIQKMVFHNLVKDKEMYNWMFMFEFKDLYEQMIKQVEENLRTNPYEMVKISETFFANKFMEQYEEIRKQIKNQRDVVQSFFYHGTRLSNHHLILESHFKTQDERATKTTDCGWYGLGVYATDNPFYAAYYANRNNNNGCEILKVDQITHIICCRVVFNGAKSRELTDENYTYYQGKPIDDYTKEHFGIYQVLVGDLNGYRPIQQIDKNKHTIVAYEYVLPYKYQIVPLLSFGIKRKDFYVVWKDEKIDSEENQKILKEMKKNLEINVYPCKDNDNALKLIKNKKYASVKLITNAGGASKLGEKLIEDVRKINRSRFICLVFAQNYDNMKWISSMKNVLFTSDPRDVREFARIEMTKENLLAFEAGLREKYEKQFKALGYKLWKIDERQLLNFPFPLK